MCFLIPGWALGHHHRDSRDDWYVYKWPSVDDRRGFPKSSRSSSTVATVFFRVGVTWSSGSPSFPLEYILFLVFFITVLLKNTFRFFSLFFSFSLYILVFFPWFDTHVFALDVGILIIIHYSLHIVFFISTRPKDNLKKKN